ncbi:MAG: 4-hydroxy-tetrahydrodipicolinate reductase [Clostridium sp.]|nr:4-hydroxy-tetrahydrodipicolinate reductase [Clostridium sp.]
MIRAIMHGCGGHMGRVISELCKNDPEIEIVAGMDIHADDSLGYPVFSRCSDCNVDADVVIDFSVAAAADELLDWCEAHHMPVVFCTTGLSEEQLQKTKKVSESAAVLRSANMSLGINLLLKLVKDAARTLAPNGFDIEILEKHHNRKLDAPSGTALAIADSINDEMNGKYHYKYDRHSFKEKRDPMEIGLQAIRGGTIVGEHDVLFCGEDEVITLQHTAYSRAIFGKGAIAAAKFLAGRKPGMYSMEDVIG